MLLLLFYHSTGFLARGSWPVAQHRTERRSSAAVMQETVDVQAVAEAPPQLPPGLAEDPLFELDASVQSWKEFQRDTPATATENLQEALTTAASIATKGVDGSTYALAHGVRTGYFATTAVLGTLAYELHELVRGSGRASGDGAASLTSVAGFGNMGGLGIDGPVATRLLLEAALCFEEDYRRIEEGQFNLPWDMYAKGHRQRTPRFAARQTARFVREAIGTLGRRARGDAEDIGIWMDAGPGLYPEYYKNNFHFQTDGWMSAQSAQVYETSTETLFLGRQDSMQRLSLPPLRAVATANGGKPRILEVACGTGRFATFVRDNHPSAEMTCVDLSPFYLDAARDNDDYWRKTAFPDKEARPPAARFVQAAAEALPFEAASYDAVVCVYLFHEMPEEARAAAAAEMARVLAPGGVLVLTDSMQRGDRPSLDGRLGNFAKLNEPHYENYIDTFLPALFTASGLECGRKSVSSSTKCLSFRKPA